MLYKQGWHVLYCGQNLSVLTWVFFQNLRGGQNWTKPQLDQNEKNVQVMSRLSHSNMLTKL